MNPAHFEDDPYLAAMNAGLRQIKRAKSGAAKFLETRSAKKFGRMVTRRLTFLEACFNRAKASTGNERFKSIETCLARIAEVRRFVEPSEDPRAQRFCGYLRALLSTLQAMLNAARRFAAHSRKRDPRLYGPARYPTAGAGRAVVSVTRNL